MAKETYVFSKENRNMLRQIQVRRSFQHRPQNSRVLVAPDALKMIEEQGLKPEDIAGYGDGGRLELSDVERYIQQKRFFEKRMAEHKRREQLAEQAPLKEVVIPDEEMNSQLEPYPELTEVNDEITEESKKTNDRAMEDFVVSESETEQIDEPVQSEARALTCEKLEEDIKAEAFVNQEIKRGLSIVPKNPAVPKSPALSKKSSKTMFSTEQDVEIQDESEEILLTSESEETDQMTMKDDELIEDVLKTVSSTKPDHLETASKASSVSEENHFDVIIVGCGLSGYHLAIQSVQAGFNTAVIEKDLIGGKALKDGVFPMAYLKENEVIIDQCRRAAQRGLKIKGMDLDLQQMMGDKAQRIDRYREKMMEHLLDLGITLFNGFGEVGMDGIVNVCLPDESLIKLKGEAVVVATGTTARIPRQCEDIPFIFTDGQAHDLGRIPEALVIVGSGSVACEYASFYSLLGSEVTVILPNDRILPDLDPDISDTAERTLAGSKVSIIRGALIKEVYRDSLDDLHLEIAKGGLNQSHICTDICVIRERIPNLQCMKNYGLEHAEKGIAVDHCGRTAFNKIYAIGGASNDPNVSPASVILAIKGQTKPTTKKEVAIRMVNMLQEIAVVGLTELEATAQGYEVAVHKLPTVCNMRYFLENSSKGTVKIVSDKQTGVILGGAFCCENAFELASSLQLVIQLGGSINDLRSVSFYRPTYAAIFGDALE